jgi:hypothetical protein
MLSKELVKHYVKLASNTMKYGCFNGKAMCFCNFTAQYQTIGLYYFVVEKQVRDTINHQNYYEDAFNTKHLLPALFVGAFEQLTNPSST